MLVSGLLQNCKNAGIAGLILLCTFLGASSPGLLPHGRNLCHSIVGYQVFNLLIHVTLLRFVLIYQCNRVLY